MEDTDLSAALTQFDRTMANIELLENLWQRYEKYIPTSVAFGLDTPEIGQIRREFSDIADSLPAINETKLEAELLPLDDISQMRFDYMDIGLEMEGYRAIDDATQLPKRNLDEYKYRVMKMRRLLVRNSIEEVVARIDGLLRSTIETDEGREFSDNEDGWSHLRELLGELDRLRGAETLSGTRMPDPSDVTYDLRSRMTCTTSWRLIGRVCARLSSISSSKVNRCRSKSKILEIWFVLSRQDP